MSGLVDLSSLRSGLVGRLLFAARPMRGAPRSPGPKNVQCAGSHLRQNRLVVALENSVGPRTAQFSHIGVRLGAQSERTQPGAVAATTAPTQQHSGYRRTSQ